MNRCFIEELNKLENTHWWHITKRELIANYIQKYIDTSEKKINILEIGAGTANISGEFIEKAYVTILDKSKLSISYCRKKGVKDLIHVDFEKYKDYKKNHYNIVITSDILEHLKNDYQALEKIFFMLKKKGVLIIHSPANPKLFSYWDKVLGHYRRYEKKKLHRLLQQIGFKVTHSSYRIFFLYPFIIIFRYINELLQRNKTKIPSDFTRLPFLNSIFLAVIKLENFLLVKNIVSFPFGTSIFIIAEKEN